MSDAFAIFFCCLVTVLIVSTGAKEAVNRQWEKDLVQRGYAQYCPLDGEFAWNGECENEKN